MEEEEKYRELQHKVEKIAGRKMGAPRDFDYLSLHILDRTRLYIAPITLKRFWGYLGENNRKKPFRNTLNTLAIYPDLFAPSDIFAFQPSPLDVIPFDIKLFGVDIIKKNKTVPTRENLKLSLESYSTSFIMFELVSPSDSWGITTPLKEQLKGDYDVCVDIGADGDIRVSIINSHTAKLVFKTSLRNYY